MGSKMDSPSKPSSEETPLWAKDSRSFFVLPFAPPNGELDQLGQVRHKLELLTLANLAETLNVSLGDADMETLRKDGKNQAWEANNFSLSKDYFHDFVGTVFGNDATEEIGESTSSSSSLKPLRLSDKGINLLNGGITNRSKGLAMLIRKQAVTRLRNASIDLEKFQRGTDTWLQFEIESAQCLFFGTGIGMLILEIEYTYAKGKSKPVPLEIIQELNFDLCRGKHWSSKKLLIQIARENELPVSNLSIRKREQAAKTRDIPPLKEAPQPHWSAQGIGHLALYLMGEQPLDQTPPKTVMPIHWEKAAVFCGVRLDRELDDHQRTLLITRLARKETSDYQPRAEAAAAGIYRPFRHLTHAASIEGGAILVESPPTKQQAEHVGNFVNNSLQPAYLPLMLWAMHEYLFLTEMMKSTSGLIDFSETTEELSPQLHNFRTRIYNYRFHFRFSHASAVSMHNDMFRLWREVFELNKILKEVNTDVGEADSKYEEIQREAKREKDQRNQHQLSMIIFFSGLLISVPDWKGETLVSVAPGICEASRSGVWPWLCREVSLHYALITLFGVAFALWVSSSIRSMLSSRRHSKRTNSAYRKKNQRRKNG